MSNWEQFFVEAGIPTGLSSKYAKAFQQNRITKSMLSDLDKATLSELGVTAIGDQLTILRRIKNGATVKEIGPTTATQPQRLRVRITGPAADDSDTYDSSMASSLRKGKPPPDRHEIYHIKMPEGNTHRTQQIMRKAHQLRREGLAVRGTTGVRQGGRSVSPIDKSSPAVRRMRMDHVEVSSSTDTIDRLGVRGLHSDQLPAIRSGRIVKHRVQTSTAIVPRGLFGRAMAATEEPQIRIQMRGGAKRGAGGALVGGAVHQRITKTAVSSSLAGRVTASIGEIPRVTLNLGGAGGVEGRLQRVARTARQPVQKRLKASQQSRLQRRVVNMAGGERPRVQVQEQPVYNDDELDYVEDEEGEEEMEDDYEGEEDEMMEDEEGVELLEDGYEEIEDDYGDDAVYVTSGSKNQRLSAGGRGSVYDRIRKF